MTNRHTDRHTETDTQTDKHTDTDGTKSKTEGKRHNKTAKRRRVNTHTQHKHKLSALTIILNRAAKNLSAASFLNRDLSSSSNTSIVRCFKPGAPAAAAPTRHFPPPGQPSEPQHGLPRRRSSAAAQTAAACRTQPGRNTRTPDTRPKPGNNRVASTLNARVDANFLLP